MEESTDSTLKKSFDASCIILGFTGSIGCGCTFLAEGIAGQLQDKGHYYKVSDSLREIAREKEIEPTVENLQQLGDDLRNENDASYLIQRSIEKIKEEDEKTSFSEAEETILIIDGIKNSGEVEYLRQFPNFYLISVHADQNIRKNRLVGTIAPMNRFDSEQDFFKTDKRDEEEDIPWGQQIKKCNYLADIIVKNNNQISVGSEIARTEFYNAFLSNYIYPMRKIRIGEKAHDRPPRAEETLMTLAYCVSKRSSCLKRKVGAVIAYSRKFEDVNPGNQVTPDTDRDLQFQVISSGYNDVPVGTPCVFTDYGKCYRDLLQEKHAKLIDYCPECGCKIPTSIECPVCKEKNDKAALECQSCKSDIISNYECENCKTKIYNKFIPGKSGAPGKLLDLCRALHAEENAILGLAGISKSEKGELVLYTTTFPCNLCANKIISAGITKVYYAEPYTMKESKELLEKYNIKLEIFEGIKSSAYFRLYV